MKKLVALGAFVVLASACNWLKPNTATDVVVPGAKAGPEVSPSAVGIATPEEPQGKGPTWLLRDSGKRCVTHPCPSWVAVDVASREEKEITGVDLGETGLGGDELAKAKERVLAGQVWVRGEIRTVEKQGPAGDGTVLFVNALVEAHEAP